MLAKPPFHSPLFTDLYQLTMAYGYFALNRHEERASFEHVFRKLPFGSNYAIACGLQPLIDFLQDFRFDQGDLLYLSTLKNVKGAPLFSQDFLDYLADLHFSCDLYAISEGTLVFPQVPLIRIEGPILQCQLLETPILNLMNFSTLIATKTARICQAAAGDEVVEFGMRRAQGPDGAMTASRAAYVGGAGATSNALAGKWFGIPVLGTHAHSWVSSFASEAMAFSAYAKVMPDNCIFLVDTYDSIQGIAHAIQVGKKLRAEGHEMRGIRIDSGDLAKISIMARKMLDEADFQNAIIFASNSLDEDVIVSLKSQHAPINAWGVGTHLVTAFDHPALDGVYKLGALQDEKGIWQPKLKLSEQPAKTSMPGRHQVRRFYRGDHYLLDIIYDLDLHKDIVKDFVLLNQAKLSANHLHEADFIDLLIPVFKEGVLQQEMESIQSARAHAIAERNKFLHHYPAAPYPIALAKNLFQKKEETIKHLLGP